MEAPQQIEEYQKSDSESYLMSVRDRVEAEIIEELLKSSRT